MPVEYVLRPTVPDVADAPDLDLSQRAVVEHRGGPLLVLAGPGTGKTTTLVELVVDRVAQGVAPEDVLVLTFSRKAAQDVRQRISRRLTGGVVPAMTFHSYCYGLVRADSQPEEFADPLRLLSAPEQEWRVAEILLGATEMGRVTWPDELAPALRTRGIAREIADFMSKARALGLEPESLRQLATARDEPVWSSLASLWSEYDQVLSLAREADYSGLVDDALGVLVAADEADELARHQPRLLVVDEYQDTDPAQVNLLRTLVGPHTELVAFGDPDQSIYAFRGADIRGVWAFGEHFGSEARPARTLSLQHCRRLGPELLAASREIVRPMGISGGMDVEEFTSFRHPLPASTTGRVETPTFTDPRAEAEHIALLLARAHLDDEVPYDEMAVLVRGVSSIAPIERALREAGVPVEVAGDEIPLARQAAVRALFHAAECAQAVAQQRTMVPEQAETLLVGPLGRLDPSEMRVLARLLRRRHADDSGELLDSRELLAECLVEPALLFAIEPHGPHGGLVSRVQRIARLLRTTADLILGHAPAEHVLWALWDGSGWPRRLVAAAETGDAEAHRDLDAVVALFDDAARAEERGGRAEIGTYLDAIQAQQIPSDTLAERGIRGRAVRLMTAHRSKGLEWDLVVVAGVQDGVWPAVRPPHSLLRSERLDPRGDGRPPTFGALLAEERRLFYVAATRARLRLIVTAVASAASDGDQPSRFHQQLEALATTAPSPVPLPRPRRGATMRGVVTELRLIAEEGGSDDERDGAARRLAVLAGEGVHVASPDRWWGLAELTESDEPVRPVDEPLALSGTTVDGLTSCALRWFLSREAKGESGSSTAQGFGLAVHVLAAELVADPPIDADTLVRHLDAVWHQLDFDTSWIAARERAEADAAVHRLVRWHRDRGERAVLGAEVEFVVEIPVGDDVVRLRGSMDRVEIDAAGRAHVVDFKTGKVKPSAADLQEHAQLGVYQVAVAHGAIPDHDVSGGAELVHLRQELARAPGLPVVQRQSTPDPDAPFFAYDLLARSTHTLRAEQFSATPNDRCAACAFRRSCPAQDGQPTVTEDVR
ncbi:hypothetical protein C6I20_02650 [Aeromicrobium sp. A1-2]|uniref:ATP-dependent helicase n=1 Tax=Aeromicrobium sp. A1-2 TaxID=2107713 RepID=UPI000E4F68F7|nr:ATP-dependent DNA helicase [Aeromicrobium sp. A1-2]AXT84201.1 hypothetical protein C6I20_02650 [Aeromicrobium sp. A1-2]